MFMDFAVDFSSGSLGFGRPPCRRLHVSDLFKATGDTYCAMLTDARAENERRRMQENVLSPMEY